MKQNTSSSDAAISTSQPSPQPQAIQHAAPLSPPKMKSTIATHKDTAPSEKEIETTIEERDDDAMFYRSLQDVLDESRLNTKEGVDSLSNLSENDPQLVAIATAISKRTGMSISSATRKILEWQKEIETRKKEEQETEEEKEKAKKEKRMATVPIWRCAVCGRADKPWIACYVRPYIVKYTEIEVG